jgi:hypothetical protein
MQPHYFPWPGYFNLIYKSNIFIFLDDAQYSKGSWHCRNYIIINKKKYLLKVPTVKSPLKTNINNKLIDTKNNWKLKQIKTIEQSYFNHEYFSDLNELLNFFKNFKTNNLSELNIELVKFICKKLDINCEYVLSSKLNIKENRTIKIVKILEQINASEYISTIGAKEYLIKDNFEELTNIKLTFNDFIQKEYSQNNLEIFVNNLSIIDLIANIGWMKSGQYIKNE